eukprot:17459-Heterococcus_DN1.PRE.2
MAGHGSNVDNALDELLRSPQAKSIAPSSFSRAASTDPEYASTSSSTAQFSAAGAGAGPPAIITAGPVMTLSPSLMRKAVGGRRGSALNSARGSPSAPSSPSNETVVSDGTGDTTTIGDASPRRTRRTSVDPQVQQIIRSTPASPTAAAAAAAAAAAVAAGYTTMPSISDTNETDNTAASPGGGYVPSSGPRAGRRASSTVATDSTAGTTSTGSVSPSRRNSREGLAPRRPSVSPQPAVLPVGPDGSTTIRSLDDLRLFLDAKEREVTVAHDRRTSELDAILQRETQYFDKLLAVELSDVVEDVAQHAAFLRNSNSNSNNNGSRSPGGRRSSGGGASQADPDFESFQKDPRVVDAKRRHDLLKSKLVSHHEEARTILKKRQQVELSRMARTIKTNVTKYSNPNLSGSAKKDVLMSILDWLSGDEYAKIITAGPTYESPDFVQNAKAGVAAVVIESKPAQQYTPDAAKRDAYHEALDSRMNDLDAKLARDAHRKAEDERLREEQKRARELHALELEKLQFEAETARIAQAAELARHAEQLKAAAAADAQRASEQVKAALQVEREQLERDKAAAVLAKQQHEAELAAAAQATAAALAAERAALLAEQQLAEQRKRDVEAAAAALSLAKAANRQQIAEQLQADAAAVAKQKAEVQARALELEQKRIEAETAHADMLANLKLQAERERAAELEKLEQLSAAKAAEFAQREADIAKAHEAVVLAQQQAAAEAAAAAAAAAVAKAANTVAPRKATLDDILNNHRRGFKQGANSSITEGLVDGVYALNESVLVLIDPFATTSSTTQTQRGVIAYVNPDGSYDVQLSDGRLRQDLPGERLALVARASTTASGDSTDADTTADESDTRYTELKVGEKVDVRQQQQQQQQSDSTTSSGLTGYTSAVITTITTTTVPDTSTDVNSKLTEQQQQQLQQQQCSYTVQFADGTTASGVARSDIRSLASRALNSNKPPSLAQIVRTKGSILKDLDIGSLGDSCLDEGDSIMVWDEDRYEHVTATVLEIHPDGSYDVKFSDGTSKLSVPVHHIRPMKRTGSVALKLKAGQSNEFEATGTAAAAAARVAANGYTDDVTKLTGQGPLEQASPELCLLNSTLRRKSGSSNTSGPAGATSTSSLGATLKATFGIKRSMSRGALGFSRHFSLQPSVAKVQPIEVDYDDGVAATTTDQQQHDDIEQGVANASSSNGVNVSAVAGVDSSKSGSKQAHKRFRSVPVKHEHKQVTHRAITHTLTICS